MVGSDGRKQLPLHANLGNHKLPFLEIELTTRQLLNCNISNVIIEIS